MEKQQRRQVTPVYEYYRTSEEKLHTGWEDNYV